MLRYYYCYLSQNIDNHNQKHIASNSQPSQHNETFSKANTVEMTTPADTSCQ